MRAEGLDASFDTLIKGLPPSLFRAPDELVLEGELSEDPYTPLLELLERAGPVVRREGEEYGGVKIPNIFLQDTARPLFLVLGYDAITTVVRDPATYVNGQGAYGVMADAVGRIVTFMDGDEHDRYRNLIMQAFNRPAVGKLSESLVEPVADYLVGRMAERFAAGEPVEIGRDLALPLVYKVMSSLLGLPQDKFSYFVEKGEALFNAPSDFMRGMAAAQELADLFGEEVARRRRQPGGDLISWLIQAEIDGERLSDDDIATHARFFLPAGIETTWRAIALMVLTLLEEPSRYAEVVQHPALVTAAAEECSRYASSGFLMARLAVRDAVLTGVPIPAGSYLVLAQGIGNRDPSRWTDPDIFDLHRPHRSHLLWNTGPHTCAGMFLARTELEVSLRGLVARFPSLCLAAPRSNLQIRGLQIRTPLAVPVTV